jgi:hypothetical protein
MPSRNHARRNSNNSSNQGSDDASFSTENEQILSIKKREAVQDGEKRQGERIVTRSVFFIGTELFSIIRWLCWFPVKPMIAIILVVLILYYSYTKLVCHYGRFLPLVPMCCPTEQLEFISILPFSKQTENSASLGDTLMNVDVSAPMHYVQAKIALTELRAQIINSDIDINFRENLGQQMSEMQKLEIIR